MKRKERVVILAGGEGRRLRPYTWILPKPLVPIGDCSILEIVVRQLRRHGLSRITLAVGYRADLVMALMGDGSKFDVEIEYFVETEPLGTIGSLARIADLSATFLVMNGDVLTDLNYTDFLDFHAEKGGIATVATTQRHTSIEFGTIQCGEDHRIVSFQEKPSFDYTVSMGVYAFEPRLLEFVPTDRYFGFDRLIHRLIGAGEQINAFPFGGHWLDIGRLDDYEEAIQEFEKHRSLYIQDEA